jgi:hypothetical protein
MTETFLPHLTNDILDHSVVKAGVLNRGIVRRGQFHKRFTSTFYLLRSQKRINTVKLLVLFALLGSVHVKAAHKMLAKLTPGIKSAANSYNSLIFLYLINKLNDAIKARLG